MAKKEAQARIKINCLLEESGWRLTDSDNGKANVFLETKTSLGDDFEHTKNGYIDYLLLDNNQKPLAVLEAKRESIPPLSAKEQARKYANSIHARYVILSNGNIHYLWDLQFGNPEPISSFPTFEMLVGNENFNPDIQSLADENITNNYIARSQKTDFESDPSYLDEVSRKEFIEKNKLKILRNYQVRAIQTIQSSVKNRNTRFLLEMATGTGKTLTCAAIIKLFLQTGNARRVLFLVDRIELENQAEKAFTQAIGNAYTVKIYKKDKDAWNTADILISTVQTLQSGNRFRNFSPTDFDLLISDEAHRSIGGNARAVFEYFKGFKIGLTATPKDYLKNVDSESNTEKSYEKRLLLDTYRTFGCESGEPTFRYSLTDGVSDPEGPFLVNPETVKILTEISTQLLSDEGLDVHKVTDEGEEMDETFGIKDYEKKFFNHETNIAWCRAFIENAMCDPISKEVGKSIVFCISQRHAAKITEILNCLATEMFPNKYNNSDFAIQITSWVQGAQQYTINFAENNLFGKTSFLPEYDSCKARVVVTVGMMTTGYDCADLLNIAFMRPVFSPSDFIQMKGRGTRLYTFKWTDYSEGENIVTSRKDKFRLIDFCGVCEYFEEKYDYEKPLSLKEPSEMIFFVAEPKAEYKVRELGRSDKVTNTNTEMIGNEGMRVDREMFGNFQKSTTVVELTKIADDDREKAKEFLKKEVFDKPQFFMNLEKLRKIFDLDRYLLGLDEALDLITGKINKPKRRQELLKQYFNELIIDKNLGKILVGDLYNTAYSVFDAYITNEQVRKAIDKQEYGRLAGIGSVSMADLRLLNGAFLPIIQYINDYVPLDKLNLRDVA